MRDIDEVIGVLAKHHPGIVFEQLKVVHPEADDDGLWFFRHPKSPYEVQLESPTGKCPFLFESDGHPEQTTAHTVAEAVLFVEFGLGLRKPAA